MECVRRLRVHVDSCRLCRRRPLCQFDPHAVHVGQRDAGVFAAVRPQDRRLQLIHQAQHRLRLQLAGLAAQLAVERRAGLEFRVVGGVEPDLAAAPAETYDAQLVRIAAVSRRPFRGGVQVTLDLRIRHLADDLGLQLRDLGVLRRVALAREQFGRDGQIAQMGQPAAHVLDVLVHAENLGHHDHGRQILLALRRRTIGGHLAVRRGDVDLAGGEPLGVRGDGGLSHGGPGRKREARGDRRGDEASTVQPQRRQQAVEVRVLIFHRKSPGKSGAGDATRTPGGPPGSLQGEVHARGLPLVLDAVRVQLRRNDEHTVRDWRNCSSPTGATLRSMASI
ncbi:hypothetical protein G6F35_012371 [Rhizopus arrhizus]|nr:hypothetical protein G6F35_012371 [Rhizopus arrhizus]